MYSFLGRELFFILNFTDSTVFPMVLARPNNNNNNNNHHNNNLLEYAFFRREKKQKKTPWSFGVQQKSVGNHPIHPKASRF